MIINAVIMMMITITIIVTCVYCVVTCQPISDELNILSWKKQELLSLEFQHVLTTKTFLSATAVFISNCDLECSRILCPPHPDQSACHLNDKRMRSIYNTPITASSSSSSSFFFFFFLLYLSTRGTYSVRWSLVSLVRIPELIIQNCNTQASVHRVVTYLTNTLTN
jgi:hypothetical protein